MSEKVNTNVFDADKKFVDFSGLDYFWSKAKTYIDGVDTTLSAKVLANEGEITAIKGELSTLNGGVGSIGQQIDAKIAELKLPETYEAKGDAAKAEAAAKEYADGLNNAMDARVKVLEGIDHDKIAADAAAAAVAGVIDDAPESFDTLKEVAAWIASNDHASDVATLMTDVENLKKIDHDAYKGADETVLASAKSYVDGKVDGKFDAVGSADAALAAAKADAAGLYQPKGDYETAGAAADAQAAAIAQAKVDAAEALKAYYTKTEVDNLLSTNSTGDRAYAKQYTDELFGSFKFAANSDIDGLFNRA